MKEQIEVIVKYEIEYDTEEVRQHCIEVAKKEVPIEIRGAGIFKGGKAEPYSIIRVQEPNNVQ